ncbi:MAG TPA: gephyrin-like molybdotransferase Glp [Acidobacteriota bacterium]|jgi:molybdopterin molybdotransferase
MISVSQALQIVKAYSPAPECCAVPLEKALGSVLAKDLYSDILMPPFDRATMDGYAFRAADVSTPNASLRVIGESGAGRGFGGIVGPGEAVRIMTGARVPQGADCVQMVEKTRDSANQVVILEPVETGKNIASAGSEVGAGDKLEAGRYIGSSVLAVLASFGAAAVTVFRPRRVALLVTGDELVDVAMRPGPDQIRNSNAYSLMAQIRSCGIEPAYLGVAPDREELLRPKLEQAASHEISIATGGVSMGKYDLVAGILKEIGATIHFDRVAIKPGKPLTFATRGNNLFFGLPGNPVSSFVAFEVFVRPVLAHLMGKKGSLAEITALFSGSFSNRGPRDYYGPARTRWNGRHWETEILKTRGSADIFRFSAADSLAVLPAESDFRSGAEVRVLLLSDYLERVTS